MGRKLTQLGFTTSYEPRAVVEHLKTDTVASILRTELEMALLWLSHGHHVSEHDPTHVGTT